MLIDANHLASVTRSHNLGGEKGKDSVAMKVARLSHSAGRNLGPGGIVVNSQFQTHREILKLQGAKKCHLFPMPARESPTFVYQLKGYCIRALKKTKSGCDSQVVIRECWASSREEKN